jgi:hypothetical protein
VGAAYQNDATDNVCSVYTDPHFSHDRDNCGGTTARVDGTAHGEIIIHAYIMGFMWNTARTTESYLNAGVLPQIAVDPVTD